MDLGGPLTSNRFGEQLRVLPVEPSLATVSLWHIDTDQPSHLVAEAASLLSEEEQEHARRCRGDVWRRRVVARAALRVALSRCVDRRAESLRFVREPHGRLRLAESSETEWHFSLARSAGRCLIAVTQVGPVGVDVEDVVPLADLDAIACHYFAPEEAAEILRLPAPSKPQAFFRCWVHKEAYLKATGVGLRDGLNNPAITVSGPAALRRAVHDDPEAWTLVTLRPGRDLIGAVAVRPRLALC